MAKKIYISPSNQNNNKYAYGNTTEDVVCGKIGKALETALKRCGFSTKYGQYDTMQNRVYVSLTHTILQIIDFLTLRLDTPILGLIVGFNGTNAVPQFLDYDFQVIDRLC